MKGQRDPGMDEPVSRKKFSCGNDIRYMGRGCPVKLAKERWAKMVRKSDV